MTTLWDTTGSEVVAALATERRAAGAIASGLALTLIVVADERQVAEAEEAASAASAAHPCRVLVVVRREILEASHPRLDAEVLIGGRLGPGESIVMRMYGRLGLHAESVVLPLLAPDAPVVTWWFGTPPDKIAHDPLGVLADRRVTDSTKSDSPLVLLRARAEDYAPGDTDLSWTRITGWRALLAAAFDNVEAKPLSATVTGSSGDPAVALLVGWLGARLGVKVDWVPEREGRGVTSVEVALEDSESMKLVRKDRRSATLTRQGQEDRTLPLSERDEGDLLAEELRRLDADAVYADALGHWAGLTGLSNRDATRKHIWRDPAVQAAAEAVG